MKRIIPAEVYRGLPCSIVAVGCALGLSEKAALRGLKSPELKKGGYLSLKPMNELVRANLAVKKRVDYRRGERPALREWAHDNIGQSAVICVLGHYLFFDGRDYYSFLFNGGDEVVAVWYLAEPQEI